MGLVVPSEVRSGLLLGTSGLDLRAKSEAGQYMEGGARIGVEYGSFALTAATTAAIGPDLLLGGSLIGAAIAGPLGAVVGYGVGAMVAPVGGLLV